LVQLISHRRAAMIINGATIVMRVNHSEMTGKFMDEVVNVPGKKAWRFHFLPRAPRKNIRLIPIRHNHN
jgi:hypothetical protein